LLTQHFRAGLSWVVRFAHYEQTFSKGKFSKGKQFPHLLCALRVIIESRERHPSIRFAERTSLPPGAQSGRGGWRVVAGIGVVVFPRAVSCDRYTVRGWTCAQCAS